MVEEKEELEVRPMGRKSKFTPQTVDLLLAAFSVGGQVKDVCAVAEITMQTFETWLKVGEALQQGKTHPDKPRPPRFNKPVSAEDRAKALADYEALLERMKEFPDQVARARAQPKIKALGRIKKAGENGNWTADAWFLERTDPENYGRRFIQADHSGTINHQHSIASQLSDEELAQIASGAKKKGKPSGGDGS